jgi:hypothetical protein
MGPAQALLRRCTASVQVRGTNWSWKKKFLCPTIAVFPDWPSFGDSRHPFSSLFQTSASSGKNLPPSRLSSPAAQHLTVSACSWQADDNRPGSSVIGAISIQSGSSLRAKKTPSPPLPTLRGQTERTVYVFHQNWPTLVSQRSLMVEFLAIRSRIGTLCGHASFLPYMPEISVCVRCLALMTALESHRTMDRHRM